MNCFELSSKIDMEDPQWDTKTMEVTNKWINQDSNYIENVGKEFENMGIDIDACIESMVVEGVDRVNKEEKQKMIEEAMEAEGVTQDQADKRTGPSGISLCSAVTSGTTVGTAAKVMQAMEAKETVQRERMMRAKAQYDNSKLHTELEQSRRRQRDAFLARWDKEGMRSVSDEVPEKHGDPGMHAWHAMLQAFQDPKNSYLVDVSVELAKLPSSTIMRKNDGEYLTALINVGMMHRCGIFLETWKDRGPKLIGLTSNHLDAPSEDEAKARLAPVINDANKDSELHGIMRDLQIMDTNKLLSYTNGMYLKILKAEGAKGLVQ